LGGTGVRFNTQAYLVEDNGLELGLGSL
jgi:hypothetical protein